MKFLKVLMTRDGKPINFEKTFSLVEKICKRSRIELLYIFGSYASNTASRLSDLDLAYLSKDKFNLDRILRLIRQFQEVFREEAIDIVDLKEVSLPLIHRIIKGGKCLYAKDLRTRIEFEITKEALYFDTLPLRRQYFKTLIKRIKDGSFGC